jgi:hypothetical protein
MRLFSTSLALALVLAAVACGPSFGANSSGRSPLAQKWFERAKVSYRNGDFEDAHNAVTAALQAAPQDNEARILGARVALTRLDFAEALKLTAGLQGSEVHGIRGRADWYAGDLEAAADELDALLTDPEVKDPWAREVAGLARRGQGRHPFEIQGGLVASVEMPPAGPALIVPCELEGERIFALVATAIGEVVIDSNSRREAAWVNLRFGDLEVKDVPALTQDLSGLSRQLNAPIRALLGVNFLRHIHATFDRLGDQFVARRDDAAAPPDATRVPLWYVRGGGMLMQAAVTPRDDGNVMLLVDTAAFLPLALDDSAWKRGGVDPATLTPDPQMPGTRTGILPLLRVGAMEMARIPALEETAADREAKGSIDVDLAGVVGASLLAQFRVTFGDDGRFMWLESDPSMMSPRDKRPPSTAASTPPSIDIPSAALNAPPGSPPAKFAPAIPTKKGMP